MNGTSFNSCSILKEDSINVVDFGMNENSDCSEIFSEILDLAVKCRKTIYIPSGTYYFTSPIQIFRSSLRIFGESKNTVSFIYSGPEIPDADEAVNAAPVSTFFYKRLSTRIFWTWISYI